MPTTPALNRDGGEHPTYADGRRPATPTETTALTARVATYLNAFAGITAQPDSDGGITVTVWPDDEDGGVITYSPVIAVTGVGE